MRILALLLLATPALAAPRLVPARDVTVTYSVTPRGQPAMQVSVAIEGGGQHLRVTGANLPTAFLIDRGRHRLAVLLPLLSLYSTTNISRYDPEETVLKGASFERGAARRAAGLRCTQWTAHSARGMASACITDDGVILSGTATDTHGVVATVVATHVQYGAVPKIMFNLPAGYRDAGPIPIGKLAGLGQ